jgi:predicted dehydrogenase
MKIVFFGLGSIGVRHLNIIKSSHDHEVYAFRTNRGQEKNNQNIEEIFSWAEFDNISPDVVFITNPTSMHVSTAIKCAQRNCHMFIEKPIDSSVDGLDTLLELVKERKLSTYVGYNLRFHPIIEYLRDKAIHEDLIHLNIISSSYLPNWRKGQDHKKSYSSISALGGGVILDLSHEIDYASYLAGPIKSVRGQYGRLSDITVDSEDYAELLLESKSGIMINIAITFASHFRQRKVIADFMDKTISCDLEQGSIDTYVSESKVKSRNIEVNYDDIYAKQLDYFFSNMGTEMMNNIDDASSLFKMMLRVKHSQ